MPRRHECIGALLLVLLGCSGAPTSVEVSGEGADTAAASIAGEATTEATTEASLVLGVLPFVAPSVVDTIYAPLAQAMGEQLNVNVRLRTATSFPAYDRNVREHDYDIALVQPFEVVRLTEEGFEPLARVDEPLVATVVARPDLEVPERSIAGIARLRVGTPPTGSAVQLLLEAELLAAGLSPGAMAITSFPTHGDCLGQLRLDGVDVCAVGPVPLREYLRQTGEELRVVVTTEPVASIAFLARPGLDPKLTAAARSFLLGLDGSDAGRVVLESVGTRRYVGIVGGDYERVRDLLTMAAA